MESLQEEPVISWLVHEAEDDPADSGRALLEPWASWSQEYLQGTHSRAKHGAGAATATAQAQLPPSSSPSAQGSPAQLEPFGSQLPQIHLPTSQRNQINPKSPAPGSGEDLSPVVCL